MYKGIRIALTVCAVLAAAGLALVLAGYLMGGSPNFSLDWKNRKITTPDAAEVRSERTPEAFRALEIEAATADITVERGESWSLRYALFDEPEITERGGTLKIKTTEHGSIGIVGISFDRSRAPSITVTVPADAALDRITVTTAAGDITLSALEAGAVSLMCGTGDIRLRDVSAAELDIEANTGDVIVENASCAGQADVEGNTGDIRISEFTVSGELECETNTGDVSLSLPEGDYALELETDLGDVIVDGKAQGRRYDSGSGVPVHAETNTGDVRFSNHP